MEQGKARVRGEGCVRLMREGRKKFDKLRYTEHKIVPQIVPLLPCIITSMEFIHTFGAQQST